jgi:hypothetical protein
MASMLRRTSVFPSFDPISQADFYRMRAFFEGVKFADDLPLDLASEEAAIRHANEGVEEQIAVQRKARDELLAEVKKRAQAKDDGAAKKALTNEEKQRFDQADAAVQELRKKLKPFMTGLLMTDADGEPGVTHVLYQGQLDQPREAVVPGFLSLDPIPRRSPSRAQKIHWSPHRARRMDRVGPQSVDCSRARQSRLAELFR